MSWLFWVGVFLGAWLIVAIVGSLIEYWLQERDRKRIIKERYRK